MNRQVIINYDSTNGTWLLGLMDDHEVKVVRRILHIYHDIGRVASNWILHGDPNG